MGWLVLEVIQGDLAFKHGGMFADNTSSVSWAQKGTATTSIPVVHLIGFLSLRQRDRHTSSLIPLHIAGENNNMADVSSHAFKHGKFFAALLEGLSREDPPSTPGLVAPVAWVKHIIKSYGSSTNPVTQHLQTWYRLPSSTSSELGSTQILVKLKSMAGGSGLPVHVSSEYKMWGSLEMGKSSHNHPP